MTRVVLAVDDDPLVLEILCEMLDDLGCEVIRAESAAEALQCVHDDERIHSIIADADMRMMDGYELIARAKVLRPNLQAIVISGRPHSHPNIFLLSKPFTEAQLEAAMAKTMGVS